MELEEMRKHEWTISWSGGKDSTATIILCHENNIPIKEIIYVRMMYDETTPATLPVMTNFVDQTKEVFESWGYPVRVIDSNKSAMDLMRNTYKKSKYEDRVNKPYGVTSFSRGVCKFTMVKISTIKSIKTDGYEMIGFASDEVDRLAKLSGKKESIMSTLEVKESDTYEICRKYNLLSPLYEIGFPRDGCWFCPNARIKEREYIRINYPELVDKINDSIKMCDYDIPYMISRNDWVKDYFKED